MSEVAVKQLKKMFPKSVLNSYTFRNENTIIVKKEDILEICRFLKSEPELEFNFLTDLCGVDYLGRNPRFEVVYNLYSISKRHRLRLKTCLDEGEKVDSVVGLWSTANWHERETYDMFGIMFAGHPDLRRILMPDDWEGHPLRKDYPLKGFR